jgi:hypothetical protein
MTEIETLRKEIRHLQNMMICYTGCRTDYNRAELKKMEQQLNGDKL